MSTPTPIDNDQPSLPLTELLVEQGIFPSNNTGNPALDSHLDPGGIPMAAIRTFAGIFNVSSSTEMADGQLKQINPNQALFALLGTTFGGDGRTNFQIPDLQGRVLVGTGQGIGLSNETLGQATGSDSVTLHPGQMPSSIGGGNVAFDDRQPSLGITYMINTGGHAPDGSTDFVGLVVPTAAGYAGDGYLPAQGQLLLINDYPDLFNAIGTTYGGDGMTTFALPDLRGRTIIGSSAQYPVGTYLGQENVSVTTNQLPASAGGHGVPIDNHQPSLAMTYLIAVSGIFPSQGGGIDPSLPYVGEIVAFAGVTAPSGWMIAAGQTLAISQNDALFSLLGTTYGGDGTTTFNLPDLRDRTVVNAGANATLGTISPGQVYGRDSITLLANNIIDPVNDHAPLAAAADFTATANQNIAASSLFSVTDADSDAITAYQFWDSTADPASGHWVVGGAAQPTGQAINVTSAQLAGATFQSGSGSDDLWVRASDGIAWGAWTEFHVDAPTDAGPTVSVANLQAMHGQIFLGSALFSNYADPFGRAATQFDFWNSGDGGGHFVLNGTALPAGQANTITAAQLSQLSYQSGSGADKLWVRTNDGLVWGAWSSAFTVAAPTDTGPTIFVANQNVMHGQTILANDLGLYSDPFNSPGVLFDYWNSGTGGGHFVLSGVTLPSGQGNVVTAAQLAQLTYQPGSGTDTLWIKANDGTAWGPWSNAFTVTAPPDNAPVMHVSNISLLHGNPNPLASSLFSASDPEGDSITSYAFWDNGAGGGQLMLNGVAQPNGQEIDVTAAQLPQLIYQASSGTDTLWVKASDGLVWSGWSSPFTVTAPPDQAPVVTGSNLGTTLGAQLSVGSLFSVTDADHDTITQYDLWDNGAGGGHFALNGTTLPSGQGNIITAAELSQTTYVAGAGADTLWVRANDGQVWGAWSNGFTVTG
jgi:microcystin-dependent protein